MIDIFEPVVMTEALITNFPPHMFLTNMFFSTRKLHPTRVVDFDIKKGKRRLAPFVSRRHKGKLVGKTDFKTQRFEPPYIKPKTVTTADELLDRQVGEPVYVQDGSNAPAARAAKVLAEDVTELQMGLNRRIEWMSAKALFTGKVPVKGEGLDFEIDLLFGAAQFKTLTGTDKWTDLTNSDPIADLTNWVRQIKQLTGKIARTVILGRNASISLEDNEKVQKKLDNRRTEAGLIKYEDLPEGAVYVGTLLKPGVDLFTYDEWYVDDETQDEEELIPENQVLVGSTAARCRRHYGAISDTKAGRFEVETFVKSWEEEDPSARFVMLQSAVLTAIEEPEAFIVATVQDAEV
jgi:hypothetical protein